MYRFFNRVSGVGSGNYIYSWKSKGLSDEYITAPTTSDPEVFLVNSIQKFFWYENNCKI